MENPCFTCFSQFIEYAPSTSPLFLTWRRLRLSVSCANVGGSHNFCFQANNTSLKREVPVPERHENFCGVVVSPRMGMWLGHTKHTATSGLICVLQQFQPPGFQRNRLFLTTLLSCQPNKAKKILAYLGEMSHKRDQRCLYKSFTKAKMFLHHVFAVTRNRRGHDYDC